MSWLFGARRLAKLGVLALNRRNAGCLLDRNARELFPLVDDKRRMYGLCRRMGVPAPELYGGVEYHSELRDLHRILDGRSEFVIKPNRGSAGRGIVVIAKDGNGEFRRHNGDLWTLEELRQHICDILSGMYSLGGQPDSALIQYRVGLHPAFKDISFCGIPDVRIVLYRDEPIMAMLRLPTRESDGRANLHQGGIGVGIDLGTGVGHHAVHHNRFVEIHPNTGGLVLGREVPDWPAVLEMARRVSRAVGLGYIGVDIVLDADLGAMLLEANARPGLAIQMANAQGLQPRLATIDRALQRVC